MSRPIRIPAELRTYLNFIGIPDTELQDVEEESLELKLKIRDMAILTKLFQYRDVNDEVHYPQITHVMRGLLPNLATVFLVKTASDELLCKIIPPIAFTDVPAIPQERRDEVTQWLLKPLPKTCVESGRYYNHLEYMAIGSHVADNLARFNCQDYVMSPPAAYGDSLHNAMYDIFRQWCLENGHAETVSMQQLIR